MKNQAMCPSCKKSINSNIGVCSCGYDTGKINMNHSYSKDYKKNPYTNESCELCNKGGRRILVDPTGKTNKSYVRCFYCHMKERDRGFNQVPIANKDGVPNWTNTEIKKSFILLEDILKPQFYGEEPDYRRYEALANPTTTDYQ
jgi:hypothetical protein